MNRVLFVCVHNAGRSQMAAAFARILGVRRVEAASAGTEPAGAIHPVVVEAMREKGIEIAGNRPRMLTQGLVDAANRVHKMGCSIAESCPAIFVQAEDWALDDPPGQPIETVRRIRDDTETRVRAMIEELNSTPGGLCQRTPC